MALDNFIHHIATTATKIAASLQVTVTSSPYGLSPLPKSFPYTLLSIRYADVSKKHCVNINDIRSSPHFIEEMIKPPPKDGGYPSLSETIKNVGCANSCDRIPALSADGAKQAAPSTVRKNFPESFKNVGISRGTQNRSIMFLCNISACCYIHKKFGCGNV